MSTADRRAELQASRAAALAARLERLLPLRGDERVLDVGAGTGAFAFAVAPRAREVVALEIDAAMVERARRDAPSNVEVVVGDGERLDLPDASFDVAATLRTLHHTPRPDALVAELVRVTRPGGAILVADQLAPEGEAEALNAFERARDASTTRVLTQVELEALFARNGLAVVRSETEREPRDLDAYLDVAGCEGAAREEARRLAPRGYAAVLGWYVLRPGQ